MAAEQESGIGGEMIRTIETKAPDTDEQDALQGTAEEGQIGSLADQELRENLGEFVAALFESSFQGNVTCSQLLMGLSEKAREAPAGNQKRFRIGIAEAWLAEPEWAGESSEEEAETAAGSREPEG
jgi:hypothetical protein